MNAEAHVTLRSDHGLAGVHAHPHAKLRLSRPDVRGESSLGCDGSSQGVLGPTEYDEERVTLRVDLAAAVLLKDSPKQAVMVGERLRVTIAQPFEEARRTLDVRE
jgi:hypothetical protein